MRDVKSLREALPREALPRVWNEAPSTRELRSLVSDNRTRRLSF
jgi:hypothetical protein